MRRAIRGPNAGSKSRCEAPGRPAPDWQGRTGRDRRAELRREAGRLGFGEEEREPFFFVNPLLDHAPAGGAEHQAAVAMAVFVAVLGVDRGALRERERLPGDREGNLAHRLEVHLDPAQRIVPYRAVAEGVDRYVAAEFRIDPVKQVVVERRSHARRVIIGAKQYVDILD